MLRRNQTRATSAGIRPRLALWILPLLALLVLPVGADADHFHRYARTVPHIDMLSRGRELHAIDGSRIRTHRLGRNEKVLWIGTADRLAVAVTSDRVIAITTHWKEWQTRLFGVHESMPSTVLAGDDFVLLVTDDRVLTVSDHAGSFVETKLGSYETVDDVFIGEQVGLVLTDRRAIGFSGRLASLIDEPVGVHEDLHRAHTAFDFATVATNKRLLVFDAPTGSWHSDQLSLR